MDFPRRATAKPRPAIFLLIGLLLTATAPRAVAQKNKPLAKQQLEFLQQQLLNRSFETKIQIGNCIPHFNRYTGKWQLYRIDTEVRPDFSINYLERVVIVFGEAGTECAEVDYREGAVIATLVGTQVVVGGIEMKDNRFELALKGPNNTYGRLKFF